MISPPTTESKKRSGALLKLSGDIHGWKNASLREVDIVDGAYFIKIDGSETNSGKPEQIQIFLRLEDAAALSADLEYFLNKSEMGKHWLKEHKEMVEEKYS